jgi:hypothetical protein
MASQRNTAVGNEWHTLLSNDWETNDRVATGRLSYSLAGANHFDRVAAASQIDHFIFLYIL